MIWGHTLSPHLNIRCCRFDFSKVYWNPRLCTEHQRVVNLLGQGDELFDVFAGVGPFAVPAAAAGKCAKVAANDLNPESHRWLVENVRLNGLEGRVECHNLDGRDFIRRVLRPRLLNGRKEEEEEAKGRCQVAMNLPALATEFLDAFVGLLAGEKVKR